jgi:PEP-CTERM/exosortase A-associated glycosyltransferase
MKVLHILDHSLPLYSGYSFRSQNIIQEQRKRGWEPVILTSPKHEESWKIDCDEKDVINGFTYYRTGKLKNNCRPIESEFRLMFALYKKILQVTQYEKPNIIHAHSPVLNVIPALKVGRKLGLPVVYEIRAFWEDAAVDHGTYKENSWKYKLVRFLETWVCRKANHVTVLCNGLKGDLIKRGIPSYKITPVFNGINPEDFKPGPPDNEYRKKWALDGKKVIGFIGSFYRYEGLDLLVQAFSYISTEMPNVVLLLVGGGEMEDELKKQIDRLGIEERVIMPGRIPHERIPGIYSFIDILVYPRYSMRLTDLVTPLKPLEAMAMAKTFVASDVGGHGELIKHNENGILFAAGDAESLTEAIEGLLVDNNLRHRLQTNGASWVQKYHTWEKTTSAYKDIYAKVMETGKNTG